MAALVSHPLGAMYSSAYADSNRLSHRASLRATGIRTSRERKSAEGVTFQHSTVQPSMNDSSDDEDLAPIKLSAEAQAILGEDNAGTVNDKENNPPHPDSDIYEKNTHGRTYRRSWISNKLSPAGDDGSPAPRAIRSSTTRPSPPKTLARDGSFMYKIHDKSTTKHNPQDSVTPAPPMRRIRVSGSRNQTRSPPSSRNQLEGQRESFADGNHVHEDSDNNEGAEDGQAVAHPGTILRSRRAEEAGLHSTTRLRRIGTGTLLNGPIRRGMIRRQSQEDNEQAGNATTRDDTPELEQSRRAREPELEDLPDQPLISYGSPKHRKSFEFQDGELVAESKQSPEHNSVPDTRHSPVRQDVLSASVSKIRPTPVANGSVPSLKSSSSNRRPIFKIPALPPLESAHDQENEPPPTFKRNKPTAPLLEIHEDQRSELPDAIHRASPEDAAMAVEPSSRPPLAIRSNNTPRRSAPVPPPKMSLIDAATSAGANSRSKKSVHYMLNGRTYRRLDVIGRGGSSRVFRIMAENYKIFALKRVNLDEADMAAIAGFKGEIDLLKKLENVDRVVRLFDYEVNEDKGVLSVMMELGESDFNKMLNEQLKGENVKLDITFTRHYWKEMLECVKAVHDHGIVHSDLKPANFLLVKGQLKLIDFGIAGAIQDNTVNVHRENQIGTPNYMSPESLVCHAPAAGQATGTKLVKLGKPSDVWSLGCILYQMTYGQPPFAHITKAFERIMSIPNPKVEIQFPGIGVGGAVVPFGLIKTLRRCLQRDQTLRPTVDELLSDSDPFLNPVAISPEMLGRVIGNVIGYCRKREEKLKQEGRLQLEDGFSILPKDDEMRGWPAAFYDKLREAGREGTAW